MFWFSFQDHYCWDVEELWEGTSESRKDRQKAVAGIQGETTEA